MTTRILIIEDNKENHDLMAYLLSNRGYTFLSAMDGEYGLKVCKQERPDLIICDIQLPKIDGYEIIRQVKSTHSNLKNIPIVAITANAMVGDGEKILALGSDGYISKPIHPELFVSQIESFLPKDKQIQNNNNVYQDLGEDNLIKCNANEPLKGKILIVDDNAADRYLSEILLRSIGFFPLLAKDVDEALEIIKNETPDLILSDYHLPVTNGLEFFQILKDQINQRHIPFILISSSLPYNQRENILTKNKLDETILRPLDPQKFIELVNNVWQRYYGN